ncbi:MAG: hypothetical protein HOP12_11590 [Candidatus Eisenbacteria bacterium]|uniref:Uncharacterized protein n=1 Tax=Eiseniibacteriota bacterium TaxID=2212470 RepID=A0A849SGC8_UNCEI|nr:hypothetical protein [Candidatus Eisenbacteria bacterium]
MRRAERPAASEREPSDELPPQEHTLPAESLAPVRAGHPVATALSVMASEIDQLGVPEAERASARAILLEAALQFERRRYEWDTLRALMSFTMDYPPLARRILPLLIPYLDVAA